MLEKNRPKVGEIYRIRYQSRDMEGLYLGSRKRGGSQRYLVALNISGKKGEIPLHFPVISLKEASLVKGEIIYPPWRNAVRKMKMNKLEREFVEEHARKKWEKFRSQD
ncbi:hypothetical protein B6U91_02420 [Candidatus Pacearchaeota archaeon ex4484_71]|nr:MAG: hypothetical protein B6U91_02420 [Candidatus Pacearchaeota archaeon ex4484_71]